MHPQIRQPKPGRCPICAMELIPVPSEKSDAAPGMRTFTVGPQAKALMQIETAPVERRFVTAEIRMVGKINYDETRFGYISARVPGRLDRLYVDYTGIPVNKGDHMVYIYSPELLGAQEELLQAIKAVEELHRSDIEYMKETALSTVEAAREKLRLLGLAKQQIEEIEKRGIPTDHLTIYAPMGGTVVEKLAQEGMYVKTGTRIYTIADLRHVWALLDAYESDLAWLRYGQNVSFYTEAYPGEEFLGRLAFINPTLDKKTRTVKVRVNVDNPEGKLKPEMFVHAVVRTNVALGGRVMDPVLAGKWICPMHPDVVRDSAGECNVCGMPLVQAESLGYVPAAEKEKAKPLVIPVSAALVTGTRAVVYVEIPDAEKPTYEGREIVLGPRAGDFYIVRRGLEEGERVVTKGNFKIDSALQIQAKPSMMTPEGGAGGAMRHHGGETPAASPQADMQMQVPQVFQMQLMKIEEAYKTIADALKTEDLPKIKKAFAALEKTLDSIDAQSLSGHSLMIWNELSMLIANDALEGSLAKDYNQAKRIFDTALQKNILRLRSRFGIARIHSAVETPVHIEAPPRFRMQLGALFQAYLRIHDALADDKAQETARSVKSAQQALAAVDIKLLEDNSRMTWMENSASFRKTLEQMSTTDNLDSLREEFEALSGEMETVIRTFGVAGAGPVYKLFCPMASGGRGAYWLQNQKETRNPYFGSKMLGCGDIVETIPPGEALMESENRHE